MAISSIASGHNNIAAVQAPPQAQRVRKAEADGDRDDGGSKAVQAAKVAPPAPSVNTSGQVVGQILNVTA